MTKTGAVPPGQHWSGRVPWGLKFLINLFIDNYKILNTKCILNILSYLKPVF